MIREITIKPKRELEKQNGYFFFPVNSFYAFNSLIEGRNPETWKMPYISSKGIYSFTGTPLPSPKIYGALEKGDIPNLMNLLKYEEGSWAICYYSKESENLYCMTDPLGKNQLYYDLEGSVSTRMDNLKMMGINHFYLNEVKEKGFFSNMGHWGTEQEETPYKGIYKMIPGELYIFKNGEQILNNKYISILPSEGSLRRLSLRRIIDKSIVDSYRPGQATLVSGGLDSSIIASVLVQENLECDYYTFDNGEDDYVKDLEDFLGIKVKRLETDNSEATDEEIMEALRIVEDPVDLGSMVLQQRLFDAIPNQYLMTGDGADELFGGYRRAMKKDTQYTDVFHELVSYHNPKLRKSASWRGKDLLTPFLNYSVVRKALDLPWLNVRQDKKVLKNLYQNFLPDSIVLRDKKPLKIKEVLSDKIEYRNRILNLFENN